jgi:hypothetical protein
MFVPKFARCLVPKLVVEVCWGDCFVWSPKVFSFFSVQNQARMAVPKMVKNGNNSLFTIRDRFCYPFGIHALKTDQNSER